MGFRWPFSDLSCDLLARTDIILGMDGYIFPSVMSKYNRDVYNLNYLTRRRKGSSFVLTSNR